jgi:predicted phage-related endonuclease
MKNTMWKKGQRDRRSFIGGSDARTIMGSEEKRGEVEPEDLSGNLIVQLGSVTEDLNRRWYELNSGQVITDIQRRVRHPAVRWMAATLDGRIESTGAVFESKFMLPWSFSEEAAAEKYMPQLQHNMWVVSAKSAVLSVITGGGKVKILMAPGSTETPDTYVETEIGRQSIRAAQRMSGVLGAETRPGPNLDLIDWHLRACGDG